MYYAGIVSYSSKTRLQAKVRELCPLGVFVFRYLGVFFGTVLVILVVSSWLPAAYVLAPVWQRHKGEGRHVQYCWRVLKQSSFQIYCQCVLQCLYLVKLTWFRCAAAHRWRGVAFGAQTSRELFGEGFWALLRKKGGRWWRPDSLGWRKNKPLAFSVSSTGCSFLVSTLVSLIPFLGGIFFFFAMFCFFPD